LFAGEVSGLRKLTALVLGILVIGTLLTAACGEKGEDIMAQAGDVVKVNYTGTLSDGTVFDSSEGRDPLEFTVGAGQMIAGFDAAVVGMKVGETKTVTIPAAEAYGERSEDNVVTLPVSALPADLHPKVGDTLSMTTAEGQIVDVVVLEITDEYIKVDANHFLAGKDLTFEITMVEINRPK
jgi:peptidylprolyl isomerase